MSKSFAILFALLSFAAHADDGFETNAAVLEGVDGTAPVEVFRAGAWAPVAVGATIEPGESIRTKASSARLVYADGSAVAISTDSELKVLPGPAREVELVDGTVWGKIEKTAATTAGNGTIKTEAPKTAPAGVYKFTLRTKAAVMGVRGTEFLVESGAAGEVAMNTLEGTVDTAPDTATLHAGRGVPVHASERIRSRAGTAFGHAEKFNGEELKAHLGKDHAGLTRFLGRPARKLRPKRAALREERAQKKAERQEERLKRRENRRNRGGG